MHCPIDQTDLIVTERQGVEIDYCPRCRGVWLDRGELDKIVERAAAIGQAPGPAVRDPRAVSPGAYPAYGYRRDDDDYDDDDDRRYRDDPRYRGRKRRGWLGDLFDFD